MDVLHGIDMRIDAGEIVALLGSNGIGKTTLNNVSGLIRPSAGEVRFEGSPLPGMKPRDIVALGIVQAPEGRRFFPNLSVAENLELGAFRRATVNHRRNLDRICTIFPRLRSRLDPLADTVEW